MGYGTKKVLSKIKDFRLEGFCLHVLEDVLGLVLYGIIADCDDFDQIADYGKDNIAFLWQELGLSFPVETASKDTLNPVLRYFDSYSLAESFKQCVRDLSLAGTQLCIDAKNRVGGTIPQGST